MNSNSPSTMKTNCIYSLSGTDGKLGKWQLPLIAFDQLND